MPRRVEAGERRAAGWPQLGSARHSGPMKHADQPLPATGLVLEPLHTTEPWGGPPHVTADGARVVVANEGDNTVSVISTPLTRSSES